MVIMAIPAIKGVIIVGGIAVAVGVALAEHEPFREWVNESWKNTNKAFDDFIGDIIPDARRRQQMNMPWGAGAEHIRWARGRGQRGWPFNAKSRRSPSPRTRAEHHQHGETSARESSAEGLLRRRRGSEGTRGDTELDIMSARVLSDEAILEKAAQENLDSMDESERTFLEDLAKAQRASVEEHERATGLAAATVATTDTATARSEKSDSEADTMYTAESPRTLDGASTPAILTPSTTNPNTQPGTPFSSTRSESGMSDDSLDIVSTSQYTPPGSDGDVLDDDRSNAGTETMSHVSRDPEMGGDVDEVRSMASSWSQVSEDEFALREREVRQDVVM